MKGYKFFLRFLIVLVVSSSVLIDWNGYPFDYNPRTIQNTILVDQYEDHNLQISHLTAKHFWVKISKRRMWIDDFYHLYTTNKVPLNFKLNCPDVDIRCAVKSFLHLLKLY